MKNLSGTGWPSFFEHVKGHMLTELDFKLIWPWAEYH
ncbi:peptide-methionine (R)-S-oxide reductase [Halomonas sp. HAL1]|nr:peptide-methionine (R)-S-oxide reductase [Halomonas sp. HAL1]WKV92367.1 peptide-methionine (R)-S-oxide reductase [Halomonas sp. HAL1]